MAHANFLVVGSVCGLVQGDILREGSSSQPAKPLTHSNTHRLSHAPGMGTDAPKCAPVLGTAPSLPVTPYTCTRSPSHTHPPPPRSHVLLYTHIPRTLAPLVTVAKSRAHVHVLPRIFPGCPANTHAPRGFLLRTRPTRPHFKASPEVGVSSCRNGLCEM